MKRFTLSLVFILVAVVAFSQNIVTPRQVGSAIPMKAAFETSKTPIDTIMIDEFFDAGSATYYTCSEWGFVLGTNDPDSSLGNSQLCQGFTNFTSGLVIEEVLVWVAEISASVGTSEMIFSLALMDDSTHYTAGTTSFDYSCPGTVLDTYTLPFSGMDTTTAGWFTHIPFTPSTIPTAQDYAIVADFADYYVKGDTFSFVCSAEGGASMNNVLNYTMMLYPAATPFWVSAADVWTLDNMVAFFPVMSHLSGMVEGNEFVNGLKLSQNFPNPSVDGTTTISYALETASNVTMTIYDNNGRVVEVSNPGFQTPGVYSLSLNNTLSSGTYYYSLEACGTRMTKKMIVQ